MIPRVDLELFLSNLVNRNNFQIFSKLLNLQDINIYNKAIEYLYNKKINLFDISNINGGINDTTLAAFFLELDNKFAPTPILNDPNSTFDALAYITSASNSPYSLYTDYNQYVNEFSALDEAKYSSKVTIGTLDSRAYATEGDFITDFNTNVLPLVLADMGVADIRDVFPLHTAYTVVSTEVTNVQNKYNSLFSGYLNSLDNANLYKFLTDRDVTSSTYNNNFNKSFQLINFDENNGDLIPNLFFVTLYQLNTLGTDFTVTEADTFKDHALQADFEVDTQNSFAWVKYYTVLANYVYNKLSLPNVDDYLVDIANLVEKISKFKQLVISINLHSKENLSVI